MKHNSEKEWASYISLDSQYNLVVNIKQVMMTICIIAPMNKPFVVIAYGIEMIPPPMIELIIESAASTTENPTGPSYIKAS